ASVPPPLSSTLFPYTTLFRSRQHDTLQLAPLASAVREGDSATALSLLRGGTLSGVHFHDAMTDPLQAHGDRLLAHWRALAEAERSEEHTSELQSRENLVCSLL